MDVARARLAAGCFALLCALGLTGCRAPVACCPYDPVFLCCGPVGQRVGDLDGKPASVPPSAPAPAPRAMSH